MAENHCLYVSPSYKKMNHHQYGWLGWTFNMLSLIFVFRDNILFGINMVSTPPQPPPNKYLKHQSQILWLGPWGEDGVGLKVRALLANKTKGKFASLSTHWAHTGSTILIYIYCTVGSTWVNYPYLHILHSGLNLGQLSLLTYTTQWAQPGSTILIYINSTVGFSTWINYPYLHKLYSGFNLGQLSLFA